MLLLFNFDIKSKRPECIAGTDTTFIGLFTLNLELFWAYMKPVVFGMPYVALRLSKTD